jgi:hypothetical protein
MEIAKKTAPPINASTIQPILNFLYYDPDDHEF